MPESQPVMIRKAEPSDVDDCVPLFSMAGPVLNALYKDRTEDLLRHLYLSRANSYGYEHARVSETEGKVQAALLSYTDEDFRSESERTDELTRRYFGLEYYRFFNIMVRVARLFPSLPPNSLYLSNLASAPHARGSGQAYGLLCEAEERARRLDLACLCLDVEDTNARARSLYERFGFGVASKAGPEDIGRYRAIFTRMIKAIAR